LVAGTVTRKKVLCGIGVDNDAPETEYLHGRVIGEKTQSWLNITQKTCEERKRKQD
jgi:hypothetical protein